MGISFGLNFSLGVILLLGWFVDGVCEGGGGVRLKTRISRAIINDIYRYLWICIGEWLVTKFGASDDFNIFRKIRQTFPVCYLVLIHQYYMKRHA